jgi:hypothetical protein
MDQTSMTKTVFERKLQEKEKWEGQIEMAGRCREWFRRNIFSSQK